MKLMLSFMVLIGCLSVRVNAQQANPILTELHSSPILERHFYGFALYDIQADSMLVALNADKFFTPASNAKVFALYSALKHLGDSIPGIAYQVSGDSLLFWGTGDPTFLHEKLCTGKVFEFLKNAPYRLYYAAQSAAQPFYRDGWAIEDYQYAFQPELSVFPVYGNTVRFLERDGVLRADPAHFDQTLELGDGSSNKFSVKRKMESNSFEVYSMAPPRGFSVRKPFKYDDELFVKLLRDTLRRDVGLIQKSIPHEVQWLYSQSTREVLREMMVHSDNFLAEQLAYVGSLLKYGSFDTHRLREDLLKTDYQHFANMCALYDESGLSFYNKVSPMGMVQLLLLLEQRLGDRSLRNYFFPAGGIDGTLKNTYKLYGGAPYVWAKTGTINGVYNQSGFVRGRSGKEYIFSFLNNNFLGNLREVRSEVARIVTYIHLYY